MFCDRNYENMFKKKQTKNRAKEGIGKITNTINEQSAKGKEHRTADV